MTKEEAMQEAIDLAWENPEGADLRRLLFPESKPTPAEFVARISAYVREKTADN